METIPEKLPWLSKNHPFSIGNDKCIFLNGGCSIVILVFVGEYCMMSSSCWSCGVVIGHKKIDKMYMSSNFR